MNAARYSSSESRCETAVKIVKEAGRLAKSYLLKSSTMRVSFPARNDLVTEADYATEDLIRQHITTDFPDDGIIGEERGMKSASEGGDSYWVIDAIDGSVNYLHQVPFWSVSLAFIRSGQVEFGIVYNPVSEELFVAQHNMGAWLNGKPINVSNTCHNEEAIIGVGHAFRRGSDYFSQLKTLTHHEADYRRLGSCALSMAYVACGRFDGYYEAYLPCWDFLAGWLLVKEAGGHVFPLPDDVLERGAEVKVINGKLNRFKLFPSLS